MNQRNFAYVASLGCGYLGAMRATHLDAVKDIARCYPTNPLGGPG